jgi:hypothetical protein
MLAAIRNEIISQLTAAFPGVNIYNSRVSPIDSDLTPALNVHTKTANAILSPSEDNFETTVKTVIFIYLTGDDKPGGAIDGGEALQTQIDTWIENVRAVFLTYRNSLNNVVHRFRYTGFDIQYNSESEFMAATIALFYDAYYREIIPVA